MFDPAPMYPDMYHPVKINKRVDFSGTAKHFTRTEHPPRYYLIDFGTSSRYEPDQLPVTEPVIVGGDYTCPEQQGDKRDKLWDPFHTDIYFIGNLVREEFIEVGIPNSSGLSRLTEMTEKSRL
jgi:hypothetical protein